MAIDRLSTTFAALADPTRRAILARLTKGDSSVLELAAPFDMTLPGISKHLKVLEKAGLIERGREAQWRPCRLRAERLKDISDWIDHYRRFWEESFDRLDEYLREVQTQPQQTEHPISHQQRKSRKSTDRRKHVRRNQSDTKDRHE